jgi:hypothetical protein
MENKKLHNNNFSHCLLISWTFLGLALASAVSGIAGLYDVRFVIVLALPLGLAAMCASLLAIQFSGEEVRDEQQDRMRLRH